MSRASLIAALTLALAIGNGVATLPAFAQDATACGPLAADQIVCADAVLARQQVLIAEHYAYLVANAPSWAAQAIGDEQVAWTERRGACGTDEACLGRTDRVRLIGLYSWYECLRTDLPLDG